MNYHTYYPDQVLLDIERYAGNLIEVEHDLLYLYQEDLIPKIKQEEREWQQMQVLASIPYSEPNTELTGYLERSLNLALQRFFNELTPEPELLASCLCQRYAACLMDKRSLMLNHILPQYPMVHPMAKGGVQ